MTDNFNCCLAVTLKEEGGYNADPMDPGGITNLGVTKAVWEHWIGHPVTSEDMRALTPAQVSSLYRTQYWMPLACDSLSAPLAMCVFDFGVNSGISRAATRLQALVGAQPDGHIGPQTLRAVQAYVSAHGIEATVKGYQAAREAFLRSLSTFPHFGHGWLNRVTAIQNAALGMQ